MSDENAQIIRIRNAAGKAMAGQPSEIQGAALAELLSIWLAGHIIQGDPAKTDALRESLLEMHIGVVRELVPVNAELIHGEPKAR